MRNNCGIVPLTRYGYVKMLDSCKTSFPEVLQEKIDWEIERYKNLKEKNDITIVLADNKEIGLGTVELFEHELFAQGKESGEDNLASTQNRIAVFDGTKNFSKELDCSLVQEGQIYFDSIFEKGGNTRGVMVLAKEGCSNVFKLALTEQQKRGGRLYVILVKDYNNEDGFYREKAAIHEYLDGVIVDVTMDRVELAWYYFSLLSNICKELNLLPPKGMPKQKNNVKLVRSRTSDAYKVLFYLMDKMYFYPGYKIMRNLKKIACLKGRDYQITYDDLVFASEWEKIKETEKGNNVNKPKDEIKEGMEPEEEQPDYTEVKLYGMDEVTRQTNQILNVFELNKRREEHNLEPVDYSNVFMFLGAPGTAKTTVAQNLGNAICKKGFLKGNKFVSTTGAQLKGQYVGQTAPRVEKLFDTNDVIFIDEAYSVTSTNTINNDSYSGEAIAELLVQIEKHSKDRVVIFAGYGGKEMNEDDNKMKVFLDANPGIASRINRTIYFRSYTPDECLGITKTIAENKGLIFGEECDDLIVDFFDKRVQSENFGNGRECRSLVENCILGLADRVASEESDSQDVKTYNTITRADVEMALSYMSEASEHYKGVKKQRIGF